MTKLSFTQEYLLCALTPKGTLPTLRNTEVASCLVAGGLSFKRNCQIICRI